MTHLQQECPGSLKEWRWEDRPCPLGAADRRRLGDGTFVLTHMDEFIEELLREEMVCDIALPHLPKRIKLEANGLLAGSVT